MALTTAMEKHGYSFRLHKEEIGWVWFEPTVTDLPRVYADALNHRGLEGLSKLLAETIYSPVDGIWTFPSIDIQKSLPRRNKLYLAKDGKPTATVVIPAGNRALGNLAHKWIANVERKHGVKPSVVDDSAAIGFDALALQDLVIFGGTHENKVALELAARGVTLFVDASIPGDDGWVVTTHAGLHASGNLVLQVTAGSEHTEEVLGILRDGLHQEGDNVIQAATHQIKQGAALANVFPQWKTFAKTSIERIVQLKGQSVDIPLDPEELSEVLAAGLQSGGFAKGQYNVAPVDIANDAAQYYRVSGDPRGLQLFRALLFRIADYYLKTPGGACYPADLDFRIGLLVLNFSRLEHKDIFSDDERLLFANLLLSCVRSVHEYAAKYWPAAKRSNSRHNHETFPALSLLYAADYFERFNLPYCERWRDYTQSIFIDSTFERSKQGENSKSYEPFVYVHGLAYSFFKGLGISVFKPGILERVVEREIVATDNFMRSVDYGDTSIQMEPVHSLLARMLALYAEDEAIHWYASEGFKRDSKTFTSMLHDYGGLRLRGVSYSPASGGWELAPVDESFLADVSPGFPINLAYDKLAYRTGWGDQDQYLLIEGVGGRVSHSHNDVNGLVRLNHRGRHWVVSNGYGKRLGLTNASKAFATRETGPVDHNTLILWRDGAVVTEMTMGGVLQLGQKDDLLWFTASQLNYGGTDWCRTYVVMSDQYVVVLDRLQINENGLERAYIEWNCLGERDVTETGCRLEQKGVFFEVRSPSGFTCEVKDADQSADWHDVLGSGAYPYASFPLKKVVFRFPELAKGRVVSIATLLASDNGVANFSISQPFSGRIEIAGIHAGEEIEIQDRDLRIKRDGAGCMIEFAEFPDIPESLSR